MKRNDIPKNIVLRFAVTFAITMVVLLGSIVKTDSYNSRKHDLSISGTELFTKKEPLENGVGISASIRESTWSKAFDLNNEGIDEHNFQAYTVDFTVSNETKDQVSDYYFRLNFNSQAFLLSAWNGHVEFHQNTDKGEIVDTVYDLREFIPGDHSLEVFSVDGESMVAMNPGDYLIYTPSTAVNAVEMPIDPYKATTPGIIMYFRIGEDLA